MANEVIHAQAVSKKFCSSLRRGMLHTSTDIVREFCGLPLPSSRLRRGEFWAVRNAAFRLAPGEGLGIIGSNGSGKTTILNLLNGVLLPDEGQVKIRGRVGALTEIGAGFHPLLSGRENIMINGMMLGMTASEIEKRADEIIDFAEIGDFIDSPVKHYSAGMYVRLGFAIAVHAPVDVLLVDEVLAVGDLAFALKCMRRIVEFREQGGAIVLVTHALHHVKFVCNDALWLEQGVVREYGPSMNVVNSYEQYMMGRGDERGKVISYDDQVRLLDFDFRESIRSGDRLELRAELQFDRPVVQPIFRLHVHSNDNESLVLSHHSDLDGAVWDELAGRLTLRMTTGPLPLRRGTYRMSFTISEKEVHRHLVWYYKQYELHVQNDRELFGILDADVRYDIQTHE